MIVLFAGTALSKSDHSKFHPIFDAKVFQMRS
jgi:hypothetical protein